MNVDDFIKGWAQTINESRKSDPYDPDWMDTEEYQNSLDSDDEEELTDEERYEAEMQLKKYKQQDLFIKKLKENLGSKLGEHINSGIFFSDDKLFILLDRDDKSDEFKEALVSIAEKNDIKYGFTKIDTSIQKGENYFFMKWE